MQYGELLLAQGDYKTLQQQNNLIDGDYSAEGDDIDGMTLLHCYWQMMQHYAIFQEPRDRPRGYLEVAVWVIRGMRTTLEIKNISSTQVSPHSSQIVDGTSILASGVTQWIGSVSCKRA
jgi:hypothetical protein